MAEYYTVLKKAIGNLESNQAEARRMVYGEARFALIGRLRAVDPPLNTAEISRQRLELEKDIRKVERESVANPGGVLLPARPVASLLAPNPVPMAPVPMPASELAEESNPSPEDVFRRAIQEAVRCGTAASAEDALLIDDPPTRRTKVGHRPAILIDLSAGRDLPRGGEGSPLDDWGGEAPAIDRADGANLPLRREPTYLEEDDLKALERKALPSRLPSLLRILLIITVILGGGALAWSKRAMIGQIITAPDSSNAASSKPKLPPIPNSGDP